MDLNTIAGILRESKYTVVLSGTDMIVENGYDPLRDSDCAYDIDKEYGYSPEEMFSSNFIATKKSIFYRFFNNHVLSQMKIPPGDGFKALAELEKRGKVQSIITRRVFGLPTRAGCEHVIEIHKNIMNYICPHCKKTYTLEQVVEKLDQKLPICDACHAVIRPDVVLFGEMVNVGTVSHASEEAGKAEVLLILGANMNSALVNYLISDFHGKNIILIHEKEHFADDKATCIYYSRVDEALKELCRLI